MFLLGNDCSTSFSCHQHFSNQLLCICVCTFQLFVFLYNRDGKLGVPPEHTHTHTRTHTQVQKVTTVTHKHTYVLCMRTGIWILQLAFLHTNKMFKFNCHWLFLVIPEELQVQKQSMRESLWKMSKQRSKTVSIETENTDRHTIDFPSCSTSFAHFVGFWHSTSCSCDKRFVYACCGL